MMAEEINPTTFKIYLYIYRSPRPVTLRDIQKGLGMKSPSLVHYHLKRLKELGLIREEGRGYVVAKNVIEGFVKFLGYPIPIYTFITALFLSSLAILVFIYPPQTLTKSYIFSLLMNITATLLFAYLSIKSYLKMRRK